MKRKTLFLAFLFFLVFSVTGFSATLKGVTLSDKATIGGIPCTLVGMGLRKKFFFKIYVGGLYMAHPSHKPKQVIADKGTKQVVMHFLYKEVSPEKLVDAWTEGFKDNLQDDFPKFRKKIDQFNAMFTEPVLRGDEVRITWLPGKGTRVTIKGKEKGIIKGEDFMAAVFAIWFGEIPADSDLKWGMLGED